jgi:hypothetical protein
MQTVSPNLAKQTRASCTLAVASGENAKLRADIANIFSSEMTVVRKAKENGLGIDCQELMPLEEDAIPTRLMTCLPLPVPTKQVGTLPINPVLFYLRFLSIRLISQPRTCLLKMKLSQQM